MNFIAVLTVVFIANGQATRIDLASESLNKCVEDIHIVQTVLSRFNSPIISISCNAVQRGASQ